MTKTETITQPKLTKNQKLVFDLLSHSASPMTAYSILDKLRDHGMRAPLQVYRALDKLLDFGMVHRLESISAFVACSHPHCHNHGLIAFAICDQCQQVTEFSDEIIENQVAQWSGDHRFQNTNTTLELRGICAECRNI